SPSTTAKRGPGRFTATIVLPYKAFVPGTYHALTVDLPEPEAELLEALLLEVGSEALEVRDGEAPPMPGVRGPRPGETIVVASFGSQASARAAAHEVVACFPKARVSLEALPDRDWSVAWRERIQAVHLGRLWVGPPWLETQADASATRVVIEPKMAFGTGD